MRQLFISDIHGCYDEMMGLLQEAEYDPAVDYLVIGGDMIDRGPDSAKVLRYVYELLQEHPDTVFALRGNHEDMMRDFFEKKGDMWLSFGKEAIDSFKCDLTDPIEFDRLIRFACNLPTIAESADYVFVHAGINPERESQIDEEILWMPYDNYAKQRFESYDAADVLDWTGGRKVVHGHTPKPYIFDDGARICCDLGAGTTDTAKLALVDLTNDKYHYYDFVTQQYGIRAIARKRKKVQN